MTPLPWNRSPPPHGARPRTPPGSRLGPLGPFGILGILGVLGLCASVAACGKAADADEVARGLAPLDVVEFVPPDHRDHDPAEAEDANHSLLREGFHDFGDVPFGEKARHTFRLLNTDPVPVTIQQLDASCTCSIPRVSYLDPKTGERVDGAPSRSGNILTVPPGVEAQLEVNIDTRNIRTKNADKLVTLRVTTDSLHQPFATLEMHLVVTRAFSIYPTDFLDLGLVPAGAGKAGSVHLSQDGDSGAVLTEVLETSDERLAASLDYEFGRQSAVWRLDAALAAGVELGSFLGWVRLGTQLPSGEPGPVMEVRVNARLVEDVHVPQGRLILTGEPLTAWADVEAVDAEMRLSLESVEHSGDGADQLELRAEPRAPDDDGASRTWRIVLSAREGAELPAGALRGSVSVRFGAPIPIAKEIPYVYVPR